ncbi:unnamed protein product [Meganyctiphanes norvegica]|uniref:Sodefrin-like factor n=1 Tax=Meganyctiphanes norvegica TaxID=48144 RepID=A0AAV2SEL6_MEGNR
MLQLLITLLILHKGCAFTCYGCSSDPTYEEYDENCMNDGYDGLVISHESFISCYTEVYENGAVERYAESSEHQDGECEWKEDTVSYWRCHCNTVKCNSDLCQHCYNGTTHSTIHTTQTTTVTTTETTEPTTVTTTPTTEPTTVTTTATTESTTVTTTATTESTTTTTESTTTEASTTQLSTTSVPSAGLRCYSCIDCPAVDEETPHAVDLLFQSCVTVTMGSESMVMRAGDYNLRQDGECFNEDAGIFCYCVGNLCNN